MYPRSCDLVSCKNDLLARMFDLLDLRYYRFNILYIWLCISWVLTTWICILCQKTFMQHILFNNSKLIEIQTFKRWLFKVKEERLENSPDKADRDIGKKKNREISLTSPPPRLGLELMTSETNSTSIERPGWRRSSNIVNFLPKIHSLLWECIYLFDISHV